jgi:hypothetical protein
MATTITVLRFLTLCATTMLMGADAEGVTGVIECYQCNPCNSHDERTYGICTGAMCMSLQSNTKGGHSIRGCVSEYSATDEGCQTERVSGGSERRCYCSTNMCNDPTPNNEDGSQPSNTAASQWKTLATTNVRLSTLTVVTSSLLVVPVVRCR